MLAAQMKSDDPILTAVGELNATLRERAATLRDDFERATGIDAYVSLPVDPNALFQAFSVSTGWPDQPTANADEEQTVSLSLRGDGIQACYVPSLLKYIADNSSMFYIWGFEEPENSVEYNLAIDLAAQFEESYSKNAQVFLTSHSPAFISLRGPKTVSYRVHMIDNATEVAQLWPVADEEVMIQLSDDIGLFDLQEETHKTYVEERSVFLKAQERARALHAQLEESTRPVVYVEGKTDEAILTTAWHNLHPHEPVHFDVKSCSPLPEEDEGGAGGVQTLRRFLSTIRADSPHVAIGIFDRDLEGITGFKGLPAYFDDADEIDAKVLRTRKAAAFLLPVPPGREQYASCLNMVLEFYFDDEVLSRTTSRGHGLVFRQPNIEERVCSAGAPVLAERVSDLPQTRQIIDGKTVFAEAIVPGLDPVEFEDFRLIFDKIRSVLDYL